MGCPPPRCRSVLPTEQKPINPKNPHRGRSTHSSCSLSNPCTTIRFHLFKMAPLHDALGIGEQLVIVLNSIIQDLPEDELLEIRSTLERSIGLVDDVLYQVSLSNFEMLTVSDGMSRLTYPLLSLTFFSLASIYHHRLHRLNCQHKVPFSHRERGQGCLRAFSAHI